jgi:hypothetical protein
MPKKSWASDEQQTWLLAKLSDFRQAQEAKLTPGFFIDLYQKFHDEWPLASPDADEISAADGNEEKAGTLKQKASEQVSKSFIIYSVTWYNIHPSDSMNIFITKAEGQPQGLGLGRL